MEYIPYTYVIRHKESGMFYYGCKFSNNGYTNPVLFWDINSSHGYFTSSKIVHKMIEEYGHESFEYEIRKTFKSAEETFKYEQRVISKIINWEKCLNSGVGGSFDCNKNRKLKINGISSYDIGREKNIEYWNSIDKNTGLTNGKLRGQKLKNIKKSFEHIEKVKKTKSIIDENGYNSHQRGAQKRMGENNSSTKIEVKNKIRDSVNNYLKDVDPKELERQRKKHLEVMQSDEVRKKMREWNKLNNPARNTKWYNDGIKSYRLKENDIKITEMNLKKGRLKKRNNDE